MKSSLQKGMIAALFSNILFAVLYLYSGWLKPMSGTEVFAWRMVMMLLGLWLLAFSMGYGREIGKFIISLRGQPKKWLLVILPTPIVAFQLWLFMYAPVNGMGVDTAMGYFLFPLTLALGGRLCFKTQLNALQIAALSAAALAVAHELWQTRAFAWSMWAVCLGYPPYYLLRRYTNVPALTGLIIDLTLIAPCALIYLAYTGALAGVANWDWHNFLLVPLLGLTSAVAMGLNLQANKDLPVPLFSMLSYLEPVLLFLSAWLILGTPVSAQSLPTYGLIGVALALSILDGCLKMQHERRSRKIFQAA